MNEEFEEDDDWRDLALADSLEVIIGELEKIVVMLRCENIRERGEEE